MTDVEDTIPQSTWEARDRLKLAVEIINNNLDGVEDPTELAEALNDIGFTSPYVFGQLLMENLGNCDRFDAEEKAFWLTVGQHMGPDWIAKFCKVGAWMRRADEFK
jgi:hypothetical protein